MTQLNPIPDPPVADDMAAFYRMSMDLLAESPEWDPRRIDVGRMHREARQLQRQLPEDAEAIRDALRERVCGYRLAYNGKEMLLIHALPGRKEARTTVHGKGFNASAEVKPEMLAATVEVLVRLFEVRS